MTRDEARDAAAVMLAYAEGKEIQHRRWGSDDEWSNFSDEASPIFEFRFNEYRVKPEPRVVWFIENGDGLLSTWAANEYEANRLMLSTQRKVKFIEDTDD